MYSIKVRWSLGGSCSSLPTKAVWIEDIFKQRYRWGYYTTIKYRTAASMSPIVLQNYIYVRLAGYWLAMDGRIVYIVKALMDAVESCICDCVCVCVSGIGSKNNHWYWFNIYYCQLISWMSLEILDWFDWVGFYSSKFDPSAITVICTYFAT